MSPALSLLFAAWSPSALASDPTEARRHDHEDVEPTPPPPASGFSFLGFAQARMALTDIVTTNALLDGQIVGQLGGLNGTVTAGPSCPDGATDCAPGPSAWYSEQRVNGFFSYRPPIADARLGLTAGFEIDFGFGDSSYNIGGNRGGGFGADQVNLQTRRLHLDVRAVDRPRHTLDVRVGLQMVTDGVRDPVAVRRDDLFRTGGGMRFWGSEATGLAAYGTVRDAEGVRLRYKAGAFTLWEFGSAAVDDVTLFQVGAELLPTWSTRVGLQAWYLNDSSGGIGGALGVGPTSQLSEMQSGPHLRYFDQGEPAAEVNVDAGWLALDGGVNHDLGKGRFGANGLVVTNFGRLTVPRVGWVSMFGLHAGAELRYRYARGAGSVMRLEGMFSSGDNPNTQAYEGTITGNAWGVVGALYGSHGTYLLFPDISAINRQSAVIYDVSNGGAGVLGGQLGVAYDLVPERLNLGATVAAAANAKGDLAGAEVNLRLEGQPLPFFKLGATGAMVLGTTQRFNPWIVFADLEWVVF
ncbi:MAG TPA: hypothetical protein PKA64_04380 [Myxococcota bacterium]|nr:hypothetical protein [Myxococcota bacterium]